MIVWRRQKTKGASSLLLKDVEAHIQIHLTVGVHTIDNGINLQNSAENFFFFHCEVFILVCRFLFHLRVDGIQMKSAMALSHTKHIFLPIPKHISSTSLIRSIFFFKKKKTLSHSKIYFLSVACASFTTTKWDVIRHCEEWRKKRRNNTTNVYSHSERAYRKRNGNGTFRRCDGFIYSNVR